MKTGLAMQAPVVEQLVRGGGDLPAGAVAS